MTDSEMIVLLDDDFRPIGEAPKLASHHADTPLHLAFSCYIFNDQNELLVTERAHSKKVWPGVWTNSVCGHPAPGESFEVAIARRALYELGLRLQDITCVLADYHYRTPPFNGIIENEFCPVFIAYVDGAVQPNPLEVAGWKWMSLATLRQEVAREPEVYSYWMKDQLTRLEFNLLERRSIDE